MNIEELREYCLSIKGASESFPFDDSTLVFKIMNKMFAYLSLVPKDGCFRVNLKCDIERNLALQERFRGVGQCRHTTSKMWNSIGLESDLPDQLIKELINHSVDEVIKKMPKKKQCEYRAL